MCSCFSTLLLCRSLGRGHRQVLVGKRAERSVPALPQHLGLRGEGETDGASRTKADIALWVSNGLAKEVGSRASCLALGEG